MVIMRYEAGTVVPADGMFALVGHYGEPSGFAAWFRKGEKLPLAVVSDELATPLWFVRVAEPMTIHAAA